MAVGEELGFRPRHRLYPRPAVAMGRVEVLARSSPTPDDAARALQFALDPTPPPRPRGLPPSRVRDGTLRPRGRRRHLPCPSRRLSRRPHVPDQPEVVGDGEARDMAVDGRGSLSPALEQAVRQVQKHRRAPPDPTLAGHDRDNHHRYRSLTATHTKRSTRTRPPVLTGRVQTIRLGRARQGKRKLGQRLVDS